MFFKNQVVKLVLITAKILYCIIVGRLRQQAKQLTDNFNNNFKLFKINNRPERLRIFGISLVQNNDFTIDTDL